MTELTGEIIRHRLDFIPSSVMSNPLLKPYNTNFEQYVSRCGKYTLTREDEPTYCNLSENAWNLHISNRDMRTIAHCGVEYVEQVRVLIAVYKNY